MKYQEMLDKFEEIYKNFDFEYKKKLEQERQKNPQGHYKASCLVKEIVYLSSDFVEEKVRKELCFEEAANLVYIVWSAWQDKEITKLNKNTVIKLLKDIARQSLEIFDDVSLSIDEMVWVLFCCEMIREKLYMQYSHYQFMNFNVVYQDDEPIIQIAYKFADDYLEANKPKQIRNSKSKNDILFVKIECINEYFGYKSYKKVEVKADMSLFQLYKKILKMFDFDDDHMHAFYLGKTGKPYIRTNINLIGSEDPYDLDIDPKEQYKFEKSITVREAMAIKTEYFLCMIFDFGDDWVFKISEYKKKVDFDPKKKYPFIVKEVGENPEQYPDFDDEYDEDEGLENIIKFS
ncbi:IS1096 element passenger TnpR family protein [Francisella philomiragia]|uniref:IS1096 element passenger TnpR family protein n=1 Tax=Francisella philomiragia TaxID=28110 RepID=UPI003512238E